ncbi:unnamed protein product [Dovyalis caffra]|uniref:Uncharacterized protein n=1 Tax=Dovyalis caffra TaxID=77055 RepID=A0AAV1RKM9_9ROSI|nr:unnamed protein product [Dovyalis caffra]
MGGQSRLSTAQLWRNHEEQQGWVGCFMSKRVSSNVCSPISYTLGAVVSYVEVVLTTCRAVEIFVSKQASLIVVAKSAASNAIVWATGRGEVAWKVKRSGYIREYNEEDITELLCQSFPKENIEIIESIPPSSIVLTIPPNKHTAEVTLNRYTIEAKNEHYKFNKLKEYMVLPNMASVPNIKAISYDVCGVVSMVGFGYKEKVALTHGLENVKPQVRQTDGNGNFCFELVQGKYYVLNALKKLVLTHSNLVTEELSCQNQDHPLEDLREIKHELQDEKNSESSDVKWIIAIQNLKA